MSDVIEFALRLRDMASGQLAGFGQTAHTTFGRVTNQVRQLGTANRTLARSYDEIENQIRDVERVVRTSTVPDQIARARRELAQLQRQASRHVGRPQQASAPSSSGGGMGAGMLSGMLGPAALIGVGYGAGRLIGDAIGDSLERQKIMTSFEVLTGSKEAGKELAGDLIDLQQNTILGAEVFKNAQTMMGFGLESEKVVGYMKQLGDVSMGDKERLGQLSLAFSQVSAAGKLTGQDLLQFINAGFNPLDAIAQRTGKSIGELKDEMSKGNVSFKMVEQAFADATSEGGKFNNMLTKIAETPAGKMAQMSGKWDEFKIKAGDAFMPFVIMALDVANKIMPMLENGIEPLSEGIQSAAEWMYSLSNEGSVFLSYLMPIKDAFVNSILPAISKTYGFVVNVVSEMMAFAKQSILIQDIFAGVGWVVDKIGTVISFMVDMLSWSWNNVLKPMLLGMENIYRWIKGVDGLEADVAFTSKSETGETSDGSPVLVETPERDKKTQEENTTILNSIATNTKKNTASVEQQAETISGGGTKVLNITVQKFLDEINITTEQLPEAVEDVRQQFLQMFAGVVAQGATS